MQNRPFSRASGQQRSDQQAHAIATADAVASLSALPAAVNGMHGGMATITSSVAGPSGGSNSPTALGLTTAQAARYVAANSMSTPGHQQATVAENRSEPVADMYAHNPNESAEERKRRLARERQRRRRKRLKEDPDATKPLMAGMSRDADMSPRETSSPAMAAVGASSLTLSTQMRGVDGGVHTHSQSQVQQGMANQFEPSTIGAGHQAQSGLQQIQVAGVTASHDELGNAGTNRAGFSTHTMGAAGMSAAVPSSSVGLMVPTQTMELQRIPSSNADVKESPVQNETPEQRKRRLARERQRRRRSRLKRDKMVMESSQKSPSSSQGLRVPGEGTSGRLTEQVEQRARAEIERRAMTSEGLGDSDRLPIGSPNSGVFGGRADVGQSLAFGEQQRGIRANSSVGDGAVQGMGLNFGTNNGLGNLQVQISGMAGGPQAQSGLMHWSQAFDSESSAKYAVENAVSAFRAQVATLNGTSRAYVVQHGLMILSSEDLSRDMMNGATMPILRPDGM